MQSERTILAWQRTTLSLAVMLVVAARIEAGSHEGWLTALLVAGAAVVLALTTPLRVRRLATASSREPQFAVMLRDGSAPFVLAALLALLCVGKLLETIAGWLG